MKQLIVLTLIITLLAGLLTGCGSKQVDEDIDPDSIVYLASYIGVDFGNSWMQLVVSIDDHLYFYTSEWNGSEKRKLQRVSLLDGSVENVDISFLQQFLRVEGMAYRPVGTLGSGRGTLIFLVNMWTEDGNKYALFELSPEGDNLGELDFGDILTVSEDRWLHSMTGDDAGNLYFVFTSHTDEVEVLAISGEGNLLGRAKTEGWVQDVVFINDGVYVSSLCNTGRNGMALKKADFTTGIFGPEITFDGLGRFGISFAAGGETGLLICNSNSLFAADIETGEITKLLEWINSDIIANDISYFGTLENGTIWLLNRTWSNYTQKMELIMLEQTTYNKLPPKTIITYGSLYLMPDVKEAVVEFNKTNPKYRIHVIEYITNIMDFDWQVSTQAFNNDLIRGMGADIIDFNFLNFSLLAAKGVLADLNPYFKKHINMNEYLENAMNAYDVGGMKLGVMTGFGFNVLVGQQSKLGEMDRWNIDEMMTWVNQFPDSVLMNTNASGIMYSMVYSSLERFIDWDTGEVNFTGDEFIKILEFASTFSLDNDFWINPNHIGTIEGLKTDKYLLVEYDISKLDQMQLINDIFDGKPKFIGTPTESGSGIMFTPTGAVGINARSENKDGAFEFIKYLLSDAFQSVNQNNGRNSNPLKLSALDEFIEMACSGDMQSNYRRLYGGFGFFDNDYYIDIDPTKNKEFVETYLDLIKRAEGIRFYDQQIIKIMQEETESFFAGQKSAQEVAEIIQNRIQLYVNENR